LILGLLQGAELIHGGDTRYLKFHSGIIAFEERLITDFGHNVLHQCLLAMILYAYTNVKDFNILTLIIIMMLMTYVTLLPKKLT